MDENRLDAKQILARLVGRYGQQQGLYLFGEVCLLQTLGIEAFAKRHTPLQLRAIAEQLKPLSLWPHPDPVVEGPPAPPGEPSGPGEEAPPEDPLLTVARSLLPAPLVLALSPDLYDAFWRLVDSIGSAEAWFEPARLALIETLGFVPPSLTVSLAEGLGSQAYRLYLDGEVIEEGEAFLGQDLVLGPSDEAPPPLPYAWLPDPAGPGWVAWMPVGPEADVPELPRLHWLTAVSRHLSAVLPRHADRMLSVPRVWTILREAEPAGYDRELERYVSLPELRLVFQTLLKQGLPLRPLAPMLESMTTAVLAELASRPLTPPEIERINRQLPAFSTRFLVGAVRRGLGLSEEPAPRFAMPAASPARLPEPALAADTRAAWRALAEEVESERLTAMFWMESLRQAATMDDHRTGHLNPLLVALPGRPGGDRLGEWTTNTGRRAVVTTLMDYVAIARPLARIRAWLDGRGALDAEAREWLEAADLATARYMALGPRRLAGTPGTAARLEAYVAGDRGGV